MEILECDADVFASHVLTYAHLRKHMGDTVTNLVEVSERDEDQIVRVLYCTSVAVLFRVFFSMAPIAVENWQSTHPHPAVRAGVITVCTVARLQAANGSFDIGSVEQLLQM